MATNKELTEKIKKLSKQLSGEPNPEDNLMPEYVIKGSGESFFFSYIDRNFIKLPRGIEIYIVDENFDIQGKTLAYTITHELILVDPDEIEYIGFN
tara:strand:+ start:721 stop:1008 length:288 start_codon:yes stop_codon:yes gene_type:complete